SALLMELQTQTQSSQGGGLQLFEFLRRIPEAAQALFPYFRISLLEIGITRGETQVRHVFELENIFEGTLKDSKAQKTLAEKLDQLFESQSENPSPRIAELPHSAGHGPFLVHVMALSGREETRLAIAI